MSCPVIDLGELWTNPAETVKLWSWLKLWGLTQPRWLFPKCVVAKSSFNRQVFLFENMLNTTGWSKFVNSTGSWCKTEIWGWYAGSKWYKLSFFGRYRLRYLWVLPIYLQKQGSIIHERCKRHPKRYTNEKGSEALSATNGLCGLRGYRFWGVPNRLCSFREPVHPTTYTPFGNGRFARFTECIPARNVLQLVCPWGTCE